MTLGLILLCAVVWVVTAIRPLDPVTWFIEQVASALALSLLLWCTGTVRFGVVSRVGMAILFCVHCIGTHYTYSLTPYDEAIAWLSGHSLNDLMGWERNHYDRFVHLVYGICLALPFREAFEQFSGCGTRAASFVSVNLVLSTSAVYEFIEWAAAVLFGGGAGMAYLGTQGDIWDAHADMALAGLGALIMFGLSALLKRLSWPFIVRAPYG